MKTLIIAEKPSVALDYKKNLSDKDTFKDYTGYSEGENYIISYTVGHLLTIADPGDIDPAYKGWKLSILPILPKQYPIKPIAGTEKQLKVLVKLLGRKDIDTVINGCDAGREGELIFRYVMEYAGDLVKNKKILRLWLQSMTSEAIKDAFKHLKTDKEMQNLHYAAKSRAEADWVVGINASRAFTAYQSTGGGFVLTPCGRVQTPTLMMMVKREQERLEFISKPYWQIYTDITAGKNSFMAQWFSKKNSKSAKEDKDDKPNRIWDIKQAQQIVQKVMGQTAHITETQKQSSQGSPLLYDLTTLQREANSRFGFSAKTTLSIAQSLYETHKLITYPRTSSKHLPEDYKGTVHNTLKNMVSHPLLGKFTNVALKNDYIAKVGKKVFDNKKISDHFAIIPTLNVQPKKLVETQQKIYLMILQRFIAVFFPPAIFMNTLREIEVAGEWFKAEGKVLVDPGYKVVFFQEEEKDSLAPLDNKSQYQAQNPQIKDFMTQPPARFSESTLLSAMEGAGKLIDDEDLKEAIKERGLGTPATRAAIIEKLVSDKYLVREDGVLIPTQKAFGLYRLIDAMHIDRLGSPELTGEWEYQLSKVEEGAMTRSDFMQQITTGVYEIIDAIRNFDEKTTLKSAGFKVLGKNFNETVNKYISEDGTIEVSKVIGGRLLQSQELIELLEKRKVGPLEGFRSRLGRTYSAILEIDAKNKINFKFDDAQDLTPDNLADYEMIGTSFIDNSPVYMTDTHYISVSALQKAKQGIKINRVLLGKEIVKENMQKMLTGEKTDLIEGFLSVKKKRKFDAYLNLKKDGALEFSFKEKPEGNKRGSKKTTKETITKTASSKISAKKVPAKTKSTVTKSTVTKKVVKRSPKKKT